MSWFERHRRKLGVVLVLAAAPVFAHFTIRRATAIEPPPVDAPRFVAKDEPNQIRRTPKGWSAMRGVRIVYLAGSPEEIGAQHTALLYDRMAEDERVIWDGFARLVPAAPLRTLLFDIGSVRHRSVDSGFPAARRRELAAEAAAFAPDPYAAHLPTYQRMVMLHALYDIALGFERSPLLGCTAFGFGPKMTTDGHALFARAFDFEAAEVFDRDKVVFVIHEDGRIPFASVAWPGFVGVVTGMNAEGVAVAVHGGRSGEPSPTGIPVAFSLREMLSTARSTDEAVKLLSDQPVMVSHILFVGDGSGRYAVIERAPGRAAHVRYPDADRPAVTNHFEGPLKDDPRDATVRSTTTTLERRKRIDELLGAAEPGSATVESTLAILRDHGCAGQACPLGDRRAIDAFIATHGIVADLTTRTLWVSTGPRLSGAFVKIDPATLVRREGKDVLPEPLPQPPSSDLETLPPDPALGDGRYEEGRKRAGGPLLDARATDRSH